ncbi:MAG: AEC family transporter [Roseburia sp.]
MNIVIILGQMLVLFGMMMIGYFCYRKNYLDEPTSKKLSGLVVNILNPILVLNSVLEKNAEGGGNKILINLGLVVLYFAFLIIFSNVIVLIFRPEKRVRNVYRLMTIFANVGFMGIPVIKSVLGAEAVFYLVFYLLAYNFVLYTYGIYLAKKAAADNGNVSEEKQGFEWKKMFNPGVIASVAAIVIYVVGIEFPAPVLTFCDYMGNATIPISMLLIGVSVAQSDLRVIFGNVKMYLFAGIRILLLPILAAVLLKQTGIDSVLVGVCVLELAMPVGSIITMMTKEYGAEDNCCTHGIVLSTLFSVLTIPIVCMFL